ncbi:MAG: hypothetical protein WD530_07345 [Vicingaceae bacterium]
MNIKLNRIALALATIFVLASCAEAPKKTEEKSEEENAQEEAVAENEIDSEEGVSFVLPSPIQIAAIFNRAGLNYKSGLTNDPENVSNYNTKTARYLNFGVYSADMAYAVLNDKQQESIDLLNAVKSLSESIGMPSVFGSGKLIESFEANIGNQDTVLRILTTIKRRTDEYLQENSEESKEAVFFSAAWVEGMFIGSQSASDNAKVTPRLIEQMTILDNLIKALQVQNDETLQLGFMVDGLVDIQKTYNNFESVKKFESREIDLAEVSLTDEELKTLTTKISDLRSSIVKG